MGKKGRINKLKAKNKKPYSVSFSEHMGIVIVQIAGDPTHKNCCDARDKAVQICLENHCSKILVDLREMTTDKISLTSCFIFAEELSKKNLCLFIAHVLPRDIKSREDVRFASSVESNRGLSTGEFYNIEEARQWLLQKLQIAQRFREIWA